MDKTNVEINYDIAYGVFILGYDLLNKYLDEQDMECDTAYEFCLEVYDDFVGSDYDDIRRPMYDCLAEYVADRFEI